jgi:hypothetical protein
MAEYSMSLTRSDAAPQEVHARRDELNLASAFQLADDRLISDHLRRYANGVEAALDSVAKKAGLKPSDKGLQYGIHGNLSGPISFWAQKQYA